MRNKIIKFEDVINKTFGFLTVVGEADPKITSQGYNNRQWKFKCVCGNIKVMIPSNVLNGTVKSCGCKKKEINSIKIQNYYNTKYKYPVEGRLYSAYKKDALDSNRVFELTKEEFISIVNNRCYYCNRDPFTIRYNKTKSKSKHLNGIDRYNNNLGYTIDNSVTCCIDCNKAKLEKTPEDFKDLITMIYKNYVEGRN